MTQTTAVIDLGALEDLIAALRARGYTVVGPSVRSRSIEYEEIESAAELPAGWTDVQEAGSYRLAERADGALFGHTGGHSSAKRYLFPPTLTVWKGGRRVPAAPAAEAPRYAFVGLRACDIHAIAIQDRVFIGDRYVEPDYAARRAEAFIVAVNCGEAGNTCFCTSMGTGPRAADGFDLALTELLDGGPHRFLVEVGSERGGELLAELAHRPAGEADERAAAAASANAEATMGRALDTDGIKELLYANAEHPRWDDAASRCLSCGNCTLVCPTCFCSTVEDVTDLAGQETERVRQWDSCFTLDHSYIHGGSVHGSGRSRYRQWMTHKLASWIDQFGSSGCVGCGRCIAWCPVAIDITEEATAIRATDRREATA